MEAAIATARAERERLDAILRSPIAAADAAAAEAADAAAVAAVNVRVSLDESVTRLERERDLAAKGVAEAKKVASAAVASASRIELGIERGIGEKSIDEITQMVAALSAARAAKGAAEKEGAALAAALERCEAELRAGRAVAAKDDAFRASDSAISFAQLSGDKARLEREVALLQNLLHGPGEPASEAPTPPEAAAAAAAASPPAVRAGTSAAGATLQKENERLAAKVRAQFLSICSH